MTWRPGADDAAIHFRGFTLDLERGLLIADGRDVPLRRKAFDLLVCLARQAGRVVAKTDLMDSVWPDTLVTEDSLTQAVREIRRALGEAGPATIRTVARRGYFFDPGSAGAAGAGEDRAIAVLPFDDRTAGADDRQAAALCEEIINGLARFRIVPVIAHTSSLAVATEGGDPKAIGRRLGARYLVDGSMERTGEGVRAAVQLVDVGDGSLLWVDRFDAVDPDPLSLEDLIARQVIMRLVARVEDASLRLAARRPPADRKAHDLLLTAIALLRGYGESDNTTAHGLLTEALRRDPTNGLAHSYLALASVILGNYGLTPPDQLRSALALASTGVGLAPEEARAHRILGLVRLYLREHDAAEHHFARSLELNPYDADTVAQMGYLIVLRGRAVEGLSWMDRAVRLNPLHPHWYDFDRAMALFLLADYRGAAEVLALVPRLGPFGLARLGATQAMAGDIEAASRTLARLSSQHPAFDPVDFATRGIAFERADDRAAILAGIHRLYGLTGRDAPEATVG